MILSWLVKTIQANQRTNQPASHTTLTMSLLQILPMCKLDKIHQTFLGTVDTISLATTIYCLSTMQIEINPKSHTIFRNNGWNLVYKWNARQLNGASWFLLCIDNIFLNGKEEWWDWEWMSTLYNKEFFRLVPLSYFRCAKLYNLMTGFVRNDKNGVKILTKSFISF